MTDLPVRGCYACGQLDDHPRFTHIPDFANDLTDEAYHWDCLPAGLRALYGITAEHPALVATDSGLRGSDLRAALTKTES